MKRLCTVPLFLLLAGCGPSVVNADPTGGMVTNVDFITNRAEGMRQAALYCKKYGKVAQPTALDPYTNIMRFDCVKS